MTDSLIWVLPDGRRLGYAEYGDPNGFPVLFCHGAPGSRWQVSPGMASAAAKQNIRVIAAERPGYGLSDPQPNQTLLDWPQDAAALMDGLGIECFGIMGFSMGGMYALACAHALPQRVTSVVLAGSVAPNIVAQEVAERMPPSLADIWRMSRDNPEALSQILAALSQAPEQMLGMFAETLPAPDKAVLARPEIEAGFRQDCVESLRREGNGMARDFMLSARDWGFTLKAIEMPVHLWHGEKDVNAPLPMAHYLASRLPQCTMHLLPDEGHLCLFEQWEEMLCAGKPFTGNS